MIIAGGPKSRTIMTAEKAWQDVCGKPSKPSTRRTAVWLSTGMIGTQPAWEADTTTVTTACCGLFGSLALFTKVDISNLSPSR
ncbi:uncharacterized protein B0T23DRAFT_375136 [Neurospora hispaniola]|uniref:Uncharacterized protein n=1 Tax=Neurospora hispaniola TaxID=588809 RepID=A0AAJ0MU83_9PEZI|nr:hypothetical protein B0T23DRAFT_375136 [Neurospora hispaniola]